MFLGKSSVYSERSNIVEIKRSFEMHPYNGLVAEYQVPAGRCIVVLFAWFYAVSYFLEHALGLESYIFGGCRWMGLWTYMLSCSVCFVVIDWSKHGWRLLRQSDITHVYTMTNPNSSSASIKSQRLTYIYNSIIFPSLNPAKNFQFISRWTESTKSSAVDPNHKLSD